MKIYETLPNGIKIVEYEESLAPALATMWNLSRSDWGGETGIKSPGQVAARSAGAAFYNEYVAMDGDVAVGFCSLGRYFGDENTLYIDLLGVRPDYQGKKIGKALVQICTERTIELGFPRIDLHTWGGNTAAVPLYKKCGYLWEDRPNSTHLVNFIPSIVKTPLFADFFKKADVYADSTRSLEIIPDGVKKNNFEFFGYTWEKDGEALAIGYERSGRQMRLIETNDYKIELIADEHELAYGMDYGCAFFVENKSGRELRVKINGRTDKNISFDFVADEKITGTREFRAKFHVGAISEPQDIWRVYPCLLADVEICGEKVTFGLGIESRFPLTVVIADECKIKQIGMKTEVHIGITSALEQDAVVEFSLPENALADFSERNHMVKIPARGKTSVKVLAKCLSMGYAPLAVQYKIKLADREIPYSHPIHYINRDLAAAFYAESDVSHEVFNGPWSICMNKHDNEAQIHHALNEGFSQGTFDPPKLGKPYDDEFNLIAPTVTTRRENNDIIMEAEYLSRKFKGMAVTRIFALSAAGLVTHRLRVENRGEKPREVMLNDTYCFGFGDEGDCTVFRYDGGFTRNDNGTTPDGKFYRLGDIDPELFEENWAFDASPAAPKGFCWSPDLKPSLKWSSYAIFEIDAGNLAPGEIFETPPVVYAYGIFNDFNSFRNYAMKLWEREQSPPASPVEICLNNFNPFASGEKISLELQNNRETNLAGKVTVTSPSKTFAKATATNPDEEEPLAKNTFELPLLKNPAALELVTVRQKMSGYEKSDTRALFFADDSQITQTHENTALVVSNSKITFRADPVYGHVCYSLICDGHEWLKNQYPDHKPFAWWNIFLGGIRVLPQKLNNNAALKEKITADFVADIRDCHGNTWSGIRTSLIITEDEDLKGATYETYFVTQPGLPMLCAFYRFKNNTGIYKNEVPEFDTFLQLSDTGNAFAEFSDKSRNDYRLRFGTDEAESRFDSVVKFSSARKQKLYFYHGNKHSGKVNTIFGDNKVPAIASAYMEAPAAAGEVFTSSPVFLLITENNLPKNALNDLERLRFI